MTVLFIFAHPDDIEYFCGGTIMKLIKKKNVHIKLCCATGQYSSIRYNELLEASKLMNILPDILEIEDGKLLNSTKNNEKVFNYIVKYKPNIVFTHNINDYHQDHKNLVKIVENAVSFKCPIIQSDTLNGQDFQPVYFNNITTNMKNEIELLSYHKSQIDKLDYITMTQIINQFRGLQSTGKTNTFCEAFAPLSNYHISEVNQIMNYLCEV